MKHTDDVKLDALIAQAFASRAENQEMPDAIPEPVYRKPLHLAGNPLPRAFTATFWQRCAVAAAAIAFCAVLPAAMWQASAGGETLRDAAERSYSEGILGESPGYFMYLMQQGGAAL